MNAVETLRKAAEKLRRLAADATDGGHGWRLVDLPGANEVWADRDAAGHDAFMVATTATRLNPNPGGQGHADAEYIAAMHPGVGLALAPWLYEVAAVVEYASDTDGVDLTAVSENVRSALAVARAVLGETS